MTTGERIRTLRKAAGFTQKEFGRKLGVSASMIGQYETDIRKPKFETLEKISKALNVSVTEFMSISEFRDISPAMNSAIPLVNDLLEIIKRVPSSDGKIHLSEEEDSKMIELTALLDTAEYEILNSSFFSGKLREQYIFLFDQLNLRGKSLAIKAVLKLSAVPDLQATGAEQQER